MIKNNVYYEFFASYMVPNSNEVGYWIDLGANSKGKVIKVYNPDIKSWVKLTDATSEDAVAPFIGSNGNWWIDNRDTGVSASGKSPIIGENGNWWIFDPALNEYADTGATAYGKTAYEYAVEQGYTGTEEDFGRMLAEVPNAVKDAKQAIKDSKHVLSFGEAAILQRFGKDFYKALRAVGHVQYNPFWTSTRAGYDEFWYIDSLEHVNANTPEDILQNMLHYKDSQKKTVNFLPIFDLSNVTVVQ